MKHQRAGRTARENQVSESERLNTRGTDRDHFAAAKIGMHAAAGNADPHLKTILDQTLDQLAHFDRDLFARTFGRNNAGALEVVLGHVPEEGFLRRFVERKEGLFRARVVGTVRPVPGVEGWLRAFRDRGAAQAVASSGPPENLEAVLGSLGFRSYFDAVVSGAELPGKPEPHVFLRAAERLGVPPASCLVVEDAVVGVRAARAAGMKVVAVATTHPAEALGEADRVVPGFVEAPDFSFR